MFGALVRSILGSANDRVVKSLARTIAAINALEPDVAKLSDADLRARTDWMRQRLADGETLDDILPDAFATVREAAKRTLGQRHFDVQMMGGVVLHKGKIAEMRTGEGKTLVSTLPTYLNALTGKGVHVVTVNDYLAKRDAGWMAQVHRFLGLTVGVVLHDQPDHERRAAYQADITYGTNHEFGFDYLRDNMKFQLSEMVQRPFNFAIVDEVDSILIDEARTPLIISGPSTDSSALYTAVNKVMANIVPDDYEKDEKARAVSLTEEGTNRMEAMLRDAGLLTNGTLYDMENVSLVHHVNQALRAHTLFSRDTDYIVKDDKVILIDEFTGRMMQGRRLSEGLHQAIEAKEGVTIERENQTLASITLQNYFRLYPKLAGMTGTAMTEAAELAEIYNLEVVEIPTNLPVQREDFDDEVYLTAAEKNNAIIDLIEDCRLREQPVLVGTVSIEKSEVLSEMLKKRRVPHNVLNARYHEQEAYIVSQAGRPGAVTIATNMAGRGTDIQLGGNLDMRIEVELADVTDPVERDRRIAEIKAEIEVAREKARAAGGLYVVGTERHESRRIDNQLRGRAGRQGDPGASKFFLSLEDDLMRIFGTQMQTWLPRLGLQPGEAIVHPWVNKALEKAQQKVESMHFDVRKQVLKFDNVMNDQRKVIYEQRREIMDATDVADTILDMRHDVIETIVSRAIPDHSYADQWDLPLLHEEIRRILALDLPVEEWGKEDGIAEDEIKERLYRAADEKMAAKVAAVGPDIMRQAEKSILLQVLDQQWKEHLLSLDHLRQGIGLRAYAQRDPLNEYKREAFDMFDGMLGQLREVVTSVLMHIEIRVQRPEDLPVPRSQTEGLQEHRAEPDQGDARPKAYGADAIPVPSTAVDPNDPSTWGKTQRNAPCPCGSGKKYKHCHGAIG